MLFTLQKLRFRDKLKKMVHLDMTEVTSMKKNLQTAFSTRQYMLSKDFEIYYYSDFYLSQVKDLSLIHI